MLLVLLLLLPPTQAAPLAVAEAATFTHHALAQQVLPLHVLYSLYIGCVYVFEGSGSCCSLSGPGAPPRAAGRNPQQHRAVAHNCVKLY